ncbi:thiol reductant ABC exporter subunit CydC [Paenibacillus cucumis (ex Kampfer et al. 2016)]|uniref:Thiol reductant ABC exporter subunit CydC n=1 Tax=Paenibacillus cucumis (ex Kampfer et al. 2016) TaxID=1776858 RepID=A0ABS7KG93_9BACL|nr:thiol reductant ABC exporter subunit CydC [Paenibacillus cucumis (ex Kampfer et al. 2016)]MBY0203169.1 thiol reductant ABC exporter subunit CydC [Paenibacillus cucumis (ex Kampfer et al. 2016)]
MKELAVLSKAMMQERKDILLSILCGFIAGTAGVALFSASGYLISQTVFAPPLYTLIVLTSMVKLLGFVRAASRYGERLASHRATFSILSRLRTSFFAKLIPVTPGIMNKNRSGDLLARIVGDVESLQHYFLRVAYPPIMVVMVFLSTVLFTAIFSFWIACLLIVGMLITAFVVPSLVLIGQRKINEHVRQQRAKLSTEVTEVLYGFRDLKVYGQLAGREQQLQQDSAELATQQQRAATQLVLGQSMHIFVTYLVTWGVLVISAFLIADGVFAGVYLAMLILATQTMFEESAAMAVLPAYKLDSEHAAKRLAETVPEPQTNGHVNQAHLSKTHLSLEVDAEAEAVTIELSHVSFQYEGEWRSALDDVSLYLAAGSKTAIVGPSGSGKSTILDLLLKLRTPAAGNIKFNDISVNDLNETSMWQNTHVVLQQSHFFRGTIRDNLLLSGETHSDEYVQDILHQVQLSNVSLDDTVYEKGENLSDGEKQRLALARAMLRKGRLWLLDEPTSSLDYVTEARVLQNLLRQAADDTLLLVCHRLAGLERMDQIVVMDQGRIVETGSFEELMERKGYFYEMKKIELQMIGEQGP